MCVRFFFNWISLVFLNETRIKCLGSFCNVSFLWLGMLVTWEGILINPWLVVTVMLSSGRLVSAWTFWDIPASRDSSSCSQAEMGIRSQVNQS